MDSKRVLGRGVISALCVVLALCTVSCSTHKMIARQDVLTSRDLEEGDRIRVQLIDGMVVEDTFVGLSDTQLECESHTLPLDSIDYVEVRHSTWPVVLFLVGAFVGMMTIILIVEGIQVDSP